MSVHKPNHGPQQDFGSSGAKKVLDPLENHIKANFQGTSLANYDFKKSVCGRGGSITCKMYERLRMLANFNALNASKKYFLLKVEKLQNYKNCNSKIKINLVKRFFVTFL